MQDWQLQDARNRFSEVVKKARDEGPQTVTVHGQRAAVVVSALEFDAPIKPGMFFTDFLLSAPLGEDPWPDDVVDAINDRSIGTGRDIGFRYDVSDRYLRDLRGPAAHPGGSRAAARCPVGNTVSE